MNAPSSLHHGSERALPSASHMLLAMLRKEFLTEWRTREVLHGSLLFALLLVVMASLSFYVERGTARVVAPGVLWITITFTGVLATARNWAREREEDVFRSIALLRHGAASFFLGKALALSCLVWTVAMAMLPLVSILFHLSLDAVFLPLLALISLGVLGFVPVATLFGSMTVRGEGRDLALSIVVFPLVTPALLSAVVATRELLGGADAEAILGWYQLLIAFDLMAWCGGTLLFAPLALDASE